MIVLSQSRTARPVRISEKLRKTHQWFEEGIQKIKGRALQRKKEDLVSTGPKLKPEEVMVLVDELEEIQRKLIPLENRHEEISQKLLAHWAHTGVSEIQSTLGRTLFHVNFKIDVDPKILGKEDVSDGWFMAMSERLLIPHKMLAHAQKIGQELCAMLLKATRASVTVNITPPSSRRKKSGQPEEDE